MDGYLSKKISFFHFLGVVFVLYIHVGLVGYGEVVFYDGFQRLMTNVICRVFQPLYFGLAGYLFFINISKGEWFYKEKIKKRFFSLFVPYVLFNALWGVLIPYFHHIYFFYTPWFENANEYFLHHNFLQSWFWRPALGQLWFVRDLIICVICAGPLFFLINKTKRNILLLLLFALLLILLKMDFSIGYSVLSFGIGAYIAIKGINIQNIGKRSRTLCMVLICLSYIFVYGFVLKKFENSVFFFSWSMFYLLWIGYDRCAVIRNIQNIKLYKMFAAYGFFTYLTHDPLMSILKFNMKGFYYGSTFICLMVYFLLPLLVYACCVCLGTCIKKLSPSFYKIIAGGR